MHDELEAAAAQDRMIGIAARENQAERFAIEPRDLGGIAREQNGTDFGHASCLRAGRRQGLSFFRKYILSFRMAQESQNWSVGDVIALRYITTDARIEMCWPCRVVLDSPDLLAVFIQAGSRYKAGPKKTAAQKRMAGASFLPPGEYEWRKDTLRLMVPGQCHSVFLFWDRVGDARRFSSYFVNMEEPLRRTPAGIDTQDHTLDIVVKPDLEWAWRDEQELSNHVAHGFYTQDLADAARLEGARVIEAIIDGTHPCRQGWEAWRPDPAWEVPVVPARWSETTPTLWERREWAYGV